MRIGALPLVILLAAATIGGADEFDNKVNALLAKNKTVGCAIAYSEGGRLKFSKGYGFANLEHKVKMRPDHVHELASVSKQFTAVSILQLVEAGKLKLDEPIDRFFEGAPDAWKKITIRHLLNHTSGLPDYIGATNMATEVPEARMVGAILDKPLLFEPGTKWQYSNSGYMLLGLLVAKVSSQTFGEYMQKNLFDPAGLKTAVWNDTRSIIPNRADGYSLRSGSVVKEGFTSSSLSKTGDGQIMASALDLIAWAKALDEGKLLKPATVAQMNEICEPSKADRNGAPAGYGFGVMLRKPEGKLIQHHGGGWMGTNTHLARYISEGKTIVILCNSEGAPIPALLALCEQRFIGKVILGAAP